MPWTQSQGKWRGVKTPAVESNPDSHWNRHQYLRRHMTPGMEWKAKVWQALAHLFIVEALHTFLSPLPNHRIMLCRIKLCCCIEDRNSRDQSGITCWKKSSSRPCGWSPWQLAPIEGEVVSLWPARVKVSILTGVPGGLHMCGCSQHIWDISQLLVCGQESPYMVGLKFVILLPQLPRSWDYRCALPYLAYPRNIENCDEISMYSPSWMSWRGYVTWPWGVESFKFNHSFKPAKVG